MKIPASRVTRGIFLSRPNRFLARVLVNDQETFAHVPNSGRMEELLIEGAPIVLLKQESPSRKTFFDLIMTWKGDTLVSIDSRVPNTLVNESINDRKGYSLLEFSSFKREVTLGESRIDFFFEKNGRKGFLETKSVTLVKGQQALFPDAPTSRGRRHLQELMKGIRKGLMAWVLFVIQREDATGFSPNDETDPIFGSLLRKCVQKGVFVFAIDCKVSETEVFLRRELPVIL